MADGEFILSGWVEGMRARTQLLEEKGFIKCKMK